MFKLKYLVIDVDGTMTDGGIYYDQQGNEWKKFCTKDAAAYFVCRNVGISTVVITGRESNATARRMDELKIDYVFQEVKEKKTFLQQFMDENNISKDELGYIGDDLNDYASMCMAGFVGCPKDACWEVKQIADYISPVKGGYGAVRDIVEHMLRKYGLWEQGISEAYGIGV